MNSFNIIVKEFESYTGAVVLEKTFTGSIGNLPIGNTDKIKLADVIFGIYNGKLPSKFTYVPTSNRNMILTFIKNK